jgi:uncharacterized repeat protein (TIGR01451 family)
VTAQPSGQAQAQTITVAAGSTGTVSVSANPPDDAEAGAYPITVEATSDAASTSIELGVTIEGTFTLNLSTPNDVLSTTANAGSPKELTFTVENAGTGPLTNVELSATPPTGWTLEFGEPVSVPPQQTLDVVGTLTPSSDAIAGDYVVTVNATAAEASADPLQLRVTVETSPLWGLVGIGLIVLTLAVLFWVFRTYGRR